MAVFGTVEPCSPGLVCGHCNRLPATMRCPEPPHDRCKHCWRGWFNRDARRRPGQWSDWTRMRRAHRLYRAEQRCLREHWRRRYWLTGSDNRASRRAEHREMLVLRAMGIGLAPLPGEFTKALRVRLLWQFVHGSQFSWQAFAAEVGGTVARSGPGTVVLTMPNDCTMARVAEVHEMAEHYCPMDTMVVVERAAEGAET